jgi:hypothetical protein
MKYFLGLLIILAAIVAGYFYSIVWMKDFRAARAEASGTEFISKVYTDYSVVGKNCQGEDTDDNGYVTCSFRVKNLENIERTVRLECPTIVKGIFGSSCKEGISIPEGAVQY